MTNPIFFKAQCFESCVVYPRGFDSRHRNYSRVPNKREGENNLGGWKLLDITIIGGWNNRGGCLEELKIIIFLAKHVSFIYLYEQ